MHPYQGIFHIERCSDGLSRRPYNQKTFTCQSTCIWQPQYPPISTAPLHGILPRHYLIYIILISTNFMIYTSTLNLHQYPDYKCLSYPTWAPLSTLKFLCWYLFLTHSNHRFRLNLTQFLWLDLTPVAHIYFWFESHH